VHWSGVRVVKSNSSGQMAGLGGGLPGNHLGQRHLIDPSLVKLDFSALTIIMMMTAFFLASSSLFTETTTSCMHVGSISICKTGAMAMIMMMMIAFLLASFVVASLCDVMSSLPLANAPAYWLHRSHVVLCWG
jgi:hypothetical protein